MAGLSPAQLNSDAILADSNINFYTLQAFGSKRDSGASFFLEMDINSKQVAYKSLHLGSIDGYAFFLGAEASTEYKSEQPFIAYLQVGGGYRFSGFTPDSAIVTEVGHTDTAGDWAFMAALGGSLMFGQSFGLDLRLGFYPFSKEYAAAGSYSSVPYSLKVDYNPLVCSLGIRF
jgi:hypothetical protein